ncbi:hypothetical protein Hypma_014690 [Hypsizygus marmoreus]|uniref:Uncharacterized protein n=1 Tax=Hypsizygus marmoreus TaxID=39966 RepID=A0A369J9W7_HYPMA|nr:hypothetical protein Hypma_014690 [Hypsizygus marmoreus]
MASLSPPRKHDKRPHAIPAHPRLSPSRRNRDTGRHRHDNPPQDGKHSLSILRPAGREGRTKMRPFDEDSLLRWAWEHTHDGLYRTAFNAMPSDVIQRDRLPNLPRTTHSSLAVRHKGVATQEKLKISRHRSVIHARDRSHQDRLDVSHGRTRHNPDFHRGCLRPVLPSSGPGPKKGNTSANCKGHRIQESKNRSKSDLNLTVLQTVQQLHNPSTKPSLSPSQTSPCSLPPKFPLTTPAARPPAIAALAAPASPANANAECLIPPSRRITSRPYQWILYHLMYAV